MRAFFLFDWPLRHVLRKRASREHHCEAGGSELALLVIEAVGYPYLLTKRFLQRGHSCLRSCLSVRESKRGSVIHASFL